MKTLLLLLLLNISCTTLVTEGELLHQWSLSAKLHSYKNAYVLIEDGEYQGIDPRDLYRINQKVRLEVNKLYVKHVWDCEDKARALVHGVKSKGFYKYSPAVGTAHYITRRGVAHAINIAFDTKGSLYFFEPQTDQVLALTEGEIASIRFLQL